jgi:hypothetical protein
MMCDANPSDTDLSVIEIICDMVSTLHWLLHVNSDKTTSPHPDVMKRPVW